MIKTLLNSNRSRSSSLNEVVLHVRLKVEVGELVTLGNLEELGELGIRVDLATIGRILKLSGSDVSIDLLANGSAGKLDSLFLSKE